MMRSHYIRFQEAIMAPGRASTTITKARVLKGKGDPFFNSTPRDEVMMDIIVGEVWVVLRAMRKDDHGREYIAERLTHVSNVRDMELVDEDEAPPKGKVTR